MLSYTSSWAWTIVLSVASASGCSSHCLRALGTLLPVKIHDAIQHSTGTFDRCEHESVVSLQDYRRTSTSKSALPPCFSTGVRTGTSPVLVFVRLRDVGSWHVGTCRFKTELDQI